jgi:hypothetical protein
VPVAVRIDPDRDCPAHHVASFTVEKEPAWDSPVSSKGAGFYQVTSRPADSGGRQIPLKAAMPEEVRVIPPLTRTLEPTPDVTGAASTVHRRRLGVPG